MATTWTNTSMNTGEGNVAGQRDLSVATGAAGTGTEAGPPTGGLALRNIDGVSVYIKSAGAAFTAGSLQAWLYNPVDATWSRAPDLDLSVPALTAVSFGGLRITVSAGILAYLPSGLTQASTVVLLGSRKIAL
jgi:hypothetical protein